MKKRGISTFPFVMIFVLIAGAIILLFFIAFGRDILSTAGIVNKLETITLLDKELASFNLQLNANKNDIDLIDKDAEIKILCDPNSLNTELTYDDNEIKRKKLILAPSKLEGRAVDAWSLSWLYPFKIDNFYYVADKNDYFLFLDSSQNAITQKFINSFPSIFDGKRVNPKQSDANAIVSNLKNTVTFIVFSNSDLNHQNSNKQNVKTVLIDFQGKKVAFKQDNLQNSEEFWGNELAYAAIFAENFQQYSCIKQHSHERLKVIADIHIEKAKILPSKTTSDDCRSKYASLINTLMDFKESPLNNFKALSDSNNDLKFSDCPPIYLEQ